MKRLIGTSASIFLLLLTLQYFHITPSDQSTSEGLRIVSLAPSLTEIVFELGAGPQLVGVTTYCTFPPKAQEKEKIGDFVNPNLEKILSLEPELILAEKWTSSKTVSRLKRLGLHVIETPSPKSFQEICAVIRKVGEALGQSTRSHALIKSMRDRVRTIEERSRGFPRRPTLYVEIDLPSWTVGRDSFISEAILLCGAKNIFEDFRRPALQASKEMIIDRNPEMILSFTASALQIRQRPGWSQIRAVLEGNVIDNLNRDLLSHGNHRLVDGMEALQEQIEQLLSRKG